MQDNHNIIWGAQSGALTVLDFTVKPTKHQDGEDVNVLYRS